MSLFGEFSLVSYSKYFVFSQFVLHTQIFYTKDINFPILFQMVYCAVYMHV